MTKQRTPNSDKDALNTSILALGPCPTTGKAKWDRASQVTGASVSTLYSACDPQPPKKASPIRLAWVELLDLINVREGGEAVNLAAWRARHDEALAGRSPREPLPEVHLERAIASVKAAIIACEAGRGDPGEIHHQLEVLHGLMADLLKAWGEKARSRAPATSDGLHLVRRGNGDG